MSNIVNLFLSGFMTFLIYVIITDRDNIRQLKKEKVILLDRIAKANKKVQQCEQDKQIYTLQNQILDVLGEDNNEDVFDINTTTINF
jgi:hypothetical protein